MKSQHSLDRFDLEAMAEGAATSRFRKEYAMERPMSRQDVRRRGIIRGKIGGDSRQGMLHLKGS